MTRTIRWSAIFTLISIPTACDWQKGNLGNDSDPSMCDPMTDPDCGNVTTGADADDGNAEDPADDGNEGMVDDGGDDNVDDGGDGIMEDSGGCNPMDPDCNGMDGGGDGIMEDSGG